MTNETGNGQSISWANAGAARSDLSMDWKVFTIRVIEALRWPVVFAICFLLVREPTGRLIDAVAARLAS